MEATLKTRSTKEDDAIAKDDLSKAIGNLKADTMKLMFIFWLGLVGATLGILFFFLKK